MKWHPLTRFFLITALIVGAVLVVCQCAIAEETTEWDRFDEPKMSIEIEQTGTDLCFKNLFLDPSILGPGMLQILECTVGRGELMQDCWGLVAAFIICTLLAGGSLAILTTDIWIPWWFDENDDKEEEEEETEEENEGSESPGGPIWHPSQYLSTNSRS